MLCDKVTKWSNWLNIIGGQIQYMLIKQDTHNSIFQIISNNENLHEYNPFYDHLFHTYIAYISVSIRRQLKKDKDSISLYGLLCDMSKNKDIIPNHKIIKPDLENDMKNLKSTSKTIESYVDKRIAHTDKRKLNKLPNSNEIDQSIIELKKIHKKYNSIINRIDVELMPTRCEWINVFKIPWINEK